MGKGLEIKLRAILDRTGSKNKIQSDIKNIEKNLVIRSRIEVSTGVIKTQVSSYEKWWKNTLDNIDNKKRKQAQSYENWWLKTIKFREINESKSIQKQAKDYENWWLKAIKSKEMAEDKASGKNKEKAFQQAKDYENWWLKAIKAREMAEDKAIKNADKKNEELSFRIQKFREQMNNKMTALKEGSAGKYTDDAAITRLQDRLINLSPAMKNAKREMEMMNVEFGRINRSAQNASAGALKIGDAFKQAFSKFPKYEWGIKILSN